MRKIHLPYLKGPDAPRFKSSGNVNMQEYRRQWNRKCPKGEEITEAMAETLRVWLTGGLGANYNESKTKGAKKMRRLRKRRKEGKKVVQTSETFVFE